MAVYRPRIPVHDVHETCQPTFVTVGCMIEERLDNIRAVRMC